MEPRHCQDKLLEWLWYQTEDRGLHSASLPQDDGADTVVEHLLRDGMITVNTDHGSMSFTRKGFDKTRSLIRAHRLAERLVCDVLHREFELSACEFEHTLAPEMVDSICTLLGHPRRCPHGKPIPEGECCRRLEQSPQTSVAPLSALDVGQNATIAYIECHDDQLQHRLDGMLIRPGATVKLHQKYPVFVIECCGASIALDESIAAGIRVWRSNAAPRREGEEKRRLFGGLRRRRHQERRRGGDQDRQ